jgi:hypothetical protein
MKSAWVVLLAVGVAPVALADEPPDLEELRAIGAQAVPARDAWEGCTASVVKEALRTERPAEEIADQALRRCKNREDQLLSVVAKRIGRQKASTVLAALRTLHRESLVSVVEELRRR